MNPQKPAAQVSLYSTHVQQCTLSLSFILCLHALCLNPAYGETSNHYLIIQTLSLHFEKTGDRQGFNPTLGYEYSPNHNVGWQTGIFRDSFDQPSGYLGINLSLFDAHIAHREIRLLLTANIIHKQFLKSRGPETRILPFPVLEIPLADTLRLNMSGTPQTPNGRNHTNGLLFMQFKYKLR